MLQGEKPKRTVATIGQKVDKIFNQSVQLYFLQLLPEHLDSNMFCLEVELTNMPESISNLLQEYTEVFEEPTFLPTNRGVFDHRTH